jgi:RNA polymerase sigma-70 factor (ECF subfamily)
MEVLSPYTGSIRDLFAAVSKGSINAFEQFFLSYKKEVYRTAYQMTHSADIAEDVSQNFFLNFWMERERLHNIQHPGAYIHRCLSNMALNVLRKKGYQDQYVRLSKLVEKDYTNNTQEALDLRQLQELVTEATAKLPLVKAKVFKMRNQEHLDYEEITAVLGISQRSAQTYYTEAARFIRLYIRKNHLGDGTMLVVIIMLLHSLEHSRNLCMAL